MINLMQGDCLERMQEIEDGSIDLILADPPYGTTACKWDSIIPLEPMWMQLKRIIKKNGAIVMTASQPFTTKLISSNMDWFKYELIWQKNRPTNIFQIRNAFGRCHENILIFSSAGMAYNSNESMVYNPQGIKSNFKYGKTLLKDNAVHSNSKTKKYKMHGSNYPRTVLNFNNNFGVIHPTQKPVALMEYLIKTYTNENDLVLDFTMGSGTTGVAAVKTNRQFIGIELDEDYFQIASERIKKAEQEQETFFPEFKELKPKDIQTEMVM